MSANFLKAFYRIADAKNWHAHHTPKNLAMAINVEAGELLKEFQWLGDDNRTLQQHDDFKRAVAMEMADVYLYLLVLADKLGIDLEQSAQQKTATNLQRHGLSYNESDQ